MDKREYVPVDVIDRTRKHTYDSSSARTNSGLSPYSGPWRKNEVTHLLKRTMFGSTLADIDHFLSIGMNAAVDELLSVQSIPPAPPVKNYDNTNIPTSDADFNLNIGETWINTNTTSSTVEYFRRLSYKAWWTGLMINQERSILEKMTLFWHNHFSTQANDISRAIWAYQNNVLCRKNALGNFKQFVKEMSVDVAMLRFLNGYLNINTSPDENYARELQELFTLGKENKPNYTEDDVKVAARVLTGWKIDTVNNSYYFNPSHHDTGNKQFSTFFNNTVITGRSGSTAGEYELNDLVDMIFSKSEEVSRFIVKKLYRYFVYYKIDSATEENVINPLAELLVSGNWEIKPVLEKLLKSEHFFDYLNQACYIKSPMDLVVGLCREFEVIFPDSSDIQTVYEMWFFIASMASLQQQNIGDPPDVAGWKAFYQGPQFHELWISTDTYPMRIYYTDSMIGTGYSKNGKKIVIDPIAFAKKMRDPSDPNNVIEDACRILFKIDPTSASKATIKKEILLSNQEQDYYWTNAWNAYINNPTQANYQVVFFRLRDLYKYLMNLAEYQLC